MVCALLVVLGAGTLRALFADSIDLNDLPKGAFADGLGRVEGLDTERLSAGGLEVNFEAEAFRTGEGRGQCAT